MNNKEYREFRIDTIGEIAKISRKAKFIKRTLSVACGGRPLSRKSILILRNFFNSLAEDLKMMRMIITNSILDDILFSHSPKAERIYAEKQKAN